MSGFVSLTLALEGLFDKPLQSIDDEKLRKRVANRFAYISWDQLSAEDRRIVALQGDYLDDPETEQERWFTWKWGERKKAIITQVAEWEAVATPTALDLTEKQKRLAELQQELARMETEYFAETALVCDAPTINGPAGGVDNAKAPLGTGRGVSVGHCKAFLAMKDLVASELHLAFVGDMSESGIGANNMLEISARKTTNRVALAALDLVDKRRGTLNSQGVILLGLARKKRVTHSKNMVSKHMERLRKVFYTHLGVTGDPFEPHHKSTGWVPLFKISDQRGKADERARQDAERRTDSLDQRIEAGQQFAEASRTQLPGDEGDEGDDADQWLRKHDRR